MVPPAAAAFSSTSTLAPAAAALTAATPAGGPIELHIEAQGEIPPDRAVITFDLTAIGADRAAAEADLASKKMNLVAALGAKGVGTGQITFGPITESSEDSVAMMAARDAVQAVAAAADDAAPRAKRKGGKRPAEFAEDASGRIGVTSAVSVSLEDVTKVDDTREAIKPITGSTSTYLLKPRYIQSDPDKARRQARELAFSRARRDADEYAGAMGYHVVRIVRVSNARPVFNLPDMLGLIAKMDMGSSSERLFWISRKLYQCMRASSKKRK